MQPSRARPEGARSSHPNGSVLRVVRGLAGALGGLALAGCAGLFAPDHEYFGDESSRSKTTPLESGDADLWGGGSGSSDPGTTRWHCPDTGSTSSERASTSGPSYSTTAVAPRSTPSVSAPSPVASTVTRRTSPPPRPSPPASSRPTSSRSPLSRLTR